MNAMPTIKKKKSGLNVVIYAVCILLAILSILPFWIMIVNATRSTYQIQQHAISLIPSGFLSGNLKVLTGKIFNPATGFNEFASRVHRRYGLRGLLLHADGLRAGGLRLAAAAAVRSR